MPRSRLVGYLSGVPGSRSTGRACPSPWPGPLALRGRNSAPLLGAMSAARRCSSAWSSSGVNSLQDLQLLAGGAGCLSLTFRFVLKHGVNVAAASRRFHCSAIVVLVPILLSRWVSPHRLPAAVLTLALPVHAKQLARALGGAVSST
jgi:hypothetical protein